MPKSEIWVPPWLSPSDDPLWVTDPCFLFASPLGRKRLRELTGSPFIRALIPFTRPLPSKSKYLPSAHLKYIFSVKFHAILGVCLSEIQI